jgi:hypothetical protein
LPLNEEVLEGIETLLAISDPVFFSELIEFFVEFIKECPDFFLIVKFLL